jgi:hypothetical protein
MRKRWFKTEWELDTRWFWFRLGTPDFTTTNPDLYPSWKPKWQLDDWKHVCESRYMFIFSWILFGFSLAWGEPLPRPQPEAAGPHKAPDTQVMPASAIGDDFDDDTYCGCCDEEDD